MPLLPPPKQPSPLVAHNEDPAVNPDESTIVQYVDGLVQESLERSRGSQDQARRNVNLYLGNHWLEVAPDDSAARYVFNRIKTVLLSHAAIQNGQRPAITLLPRQSGRKGLCFIDTTVLASVLPLMKTNAEIAANLQHIPPECMTPPPGVPAPLPREVYDMLEQAVEQGQMLVQQAKERKLPPPKVIPPELIVEISDATFAEAVQLLFDAKWEECNADYYAITDSFYNGIVGWNHMFYRWDALAERHVLALCEFPQVFLDPTRTDISESQTAVWDYVLSEEQATAEFPEFSRIIDQDFTQGRVWPAGSYTYTYASIYADTTFRRKMGAIRFAWVRNQPYPMSPEEALARGLIVKGFPYAAPHTPTGTEADDEHDDDLTEGQSEDSADSESGNEDGREQSTEGAGRSAGVEDQPGSQQVHIDGNGGETVSDQSDLAPVEGGAVGGDASQGAQTPGDQPPGVSAQPAPTAFLLVQNGQPTHEVKPWGPGWPMRRGIRELVIIGSRLVEDRECLDPQIPLTHNVNFPRMYGPLGQGTPEDLELLNMAVNEVISDLIHHIRQEAFGTTIVAEELQKKNPEIAKEVYRRPGTVLTAPGDLMRELKEMLQTLQPPPASPDIWRFLTQLLDLIDKQGDMAQVLQGQASPGWSGDAIGKLQGAAQGSILFRAKRGETMLKYLGFLMLGGLERMSVEAMALAIPDYPIYVWDAFKVWWKQGITLDLHVEITSGGGAAKQQKSQQRIQAAQLGVQISQQTLQESLDLDPDKEQKNIQEWNAATQPTAPTTAPAQGQPAQKPMQ